MHDIVRDFAISRCADLQALHRTFLDALLAARPELGAADVRRIVRQSARDLGPPGPDRAMGAGRLDAFAALAHGPLPEVAAALSRLRSLKVIG